MFSRPELITTGWSVCYVDFDVDVFVMLLCCFQFDTLLILRACVFSDFDGHMSKTENWHMLTCAGS